MTYERNKRASRVLMGAMMFTTLTAAAWAAPATAIYAGENAGTQGNWIGTYGSDGYLIANGAAQNPKFGSVSVTGAQTFTWGAGAYLTDPRALQADPQDNPVLSRI